MGVHLKQKSEQNYRSTSNSIQPQTQSIGHGLAPSSNSNPAFKLKPTKSQVLEFPAPDTKHCFVNVFTRDFGSAFEELFVAFLSRLRSSLSSLLFQVFLSLGLRHRCQVLFRPLSVPPARVAENIEILRVDEKVKDVLRDFCAFGVYPHFTFFASYPLTVLFRVSTISTLMFTDQGQYILSCSHICLILSGTPTRVLP